MSPTRFDADTLYFALAVFEDVAFPMDVGFEAECGRIAVFDVADGDRLAWLQETALGSGLSITRDAFTAPFRTAIEAKKPLTDVELTIASEGPFHFGQNQSFNHLEYHFLSGRVHNVKNAKIKIDGLVERIVRVLNEEFAAFAAVLGGELARGRFGTVRLDTGDDFPYSAGFVSRGRHYVFLTHRDLDSKPPFPGKTFSFTEQATFGVSCADVGYLVLALLSLVLQKTRTDALTKHKTIVSKIWEAAFYHTEDRLDMGITFLLLYQYYTHDYFKGAMFFIRTPLKQVLDRFGDRRQAVVDKFFWLEETELRGELKPPEIEPKEYIKQVRDGEYFSFGTRIDMKGDTVLIEFRSFHKILRKHMTIHRGLRAAGSLVVSAAEI